MSQSVGSPALSHVSPAFAVGEEVVFPALHFLQQAFHVLIVCVQTKQANHGVEERDARDDEYNDVEGAKH